MFELVFNLKGRQADRPDDSAERACEGGQGDQVTTLRAARIELNSPSTQSREICLTRVDQFNLKLNLIFPLDETWFV